LWEGTDSTTTTDYQLIRATLSSPPYEASGYQASYDAYGRVASDWSSYIQARIASNGAYIIGYYASGQFVTMRSGYTFVPGAGSSVLLYCGDALNSLPRLFRLTVNGRIVTEFTESGTGSQYVCRTGEPGGAPPSKVAATATRCCSTLTRKLIRLVLTSGSGRISERAC
jgi:hypothetical protein